MIVLVFFPPVIQTSTFDLFKFARHCVDTTFNSFVYPRFQIHVSYYDEHILST